MYQTAFLRFVYREMLRIRACEEALVEPILDGEIGCPVHLYSGEEAVAVGVCAALGERDVVFGNHRSHGHYLARTGDLAGMVAEVFCRASGCSKGRGGSMHLSAPEMGFLGAAPIVGGTVALAVGSALAMRVRGDGGIAVSFFGDGAAGEGVLYEALNLAALWRLPLLFVCENNLYSTHLPIRDCRASESIWECGAPFGVPGEAVDGNDVLGVYEAARRAIGYCRSGGGPFFMECRTYRLRGHVGPDDKIQGSHTEIRPKEEVERWRERDPLHLFRAWLLAEGRLSEEEARTIEAKAEEDVREALSMARAAAFPQPEELGSYVFEGSEA